MLHQVNPIVTITATSDSASTFTDADGLVVHRTPCGCQSCYNHAVARGLGFGRKGA